MNVSIKQLFADRILARSFFVGIFLVLFQLLFIVLSFAKLPPFIPLFNQMPWGEERLGTKIQIFIPVGVALAVFIGNFIATFSLYTKMPLLCRFLSLTSLLVALFALILIVRTILIIL